jgi:hypothetical protein
MRDIDPGGRRGIEQGVTVGIAPDRTKKPRSQASAGQAERNVECDAAGAAGHIARHVAACGDAPGAAADHVPMGRADAKNVAWAGHRDRIVPDPAARRKTDCLP